MSRRTAAPCAVLLAFVCSGFFAACSKTPPVYEGFHDITNCNGIMGWAWDKNRPDRPIQVDIYDGDMLLATVTAKDFREDLLKAGIGNGQHGFTYPVPPSLRDGKPHSIRMRYAATAIDLNNTPREINCTVEP